MTTLGFDNYVEPLKLYLQKYREANKGDKPVGEASTMIISPVSSGVIATSSMSAGTNANPGTVVFAFTEMPQTTQASGEPEFIG